MPDLAVPWAGLRLATPIVVGASPLTDDLDSLKECEAAGAGAVVMHSLFEEQIIAEQMAAHRFIDSHVDMDAEARTFLPESSVFNLGAKPYLDRLRLLRERLKIPVIASLNGTSLGSWAHLASDLASAGAAAIELNLYDVATSFTMSGSQLEAGQLLLVSSVVRATRVPVIVKLSPFYSSLPAFVRELEKMGVRGIVVFNRFYQPNVDLEALDVSRDLPLSTSAELPLRLHACAILAGRTQLELGVTGGVHSGDDAARAILCGASITQVVSALLQNGPGHVRTIIAGLESRLEMLGYRSATEACGALSLQRAPDPHAWERLNYARMLQSWLPRRGSYMRLDERL